MALMGHALSSGAEVFSGDHIAIWAGGIGAVLIDGDIEGFRSIYKGQIRIMVFAEVIGDVDLLVMPAQIIVPA